MYLSSILNCKTMLNKYDVHNRLLKIWSTVFPRTTCNKVDHERSWWELTDKYQERILTLADGVITAHRDGRVVLCVPVDLLPLEF